MASVFTTPSFFRGQTIEFLTTFYDFNGAVVQPPSAFVNLAFGDGSPDIEIALAPVGGGSVQWSGTWDSRGVSAPAVVAWSIHSAAPIPCAVEDGIFALTANPANLPTF